MAGTARTASANGEIAGHAKPIWIERSTVLLEVADVDPSREGEMSSRGVVAGLRKRSLSFS